MPENRGAELSALVLAAGESSRMGTVKALEKVGRQTAIERVISSLISAGVADIVVVTGYHENSLAPLLSTLPVRTARNPQPERGMFSSLQIGAAALAASSAGFFVLPVDHALVAPTVLTRLARAFAAGQADIVHPLCAGLRGHPPLLVRSLAEHLLTAPATSNLRKLLHARELDGKALEVEVEDLTVILDMDLPRDLEMMRRFALLLDPATQPGRAQRPEDTSGSLLDDTEVDYILSLLQTPPHVVEHCRAVARVGETLAQALRPSLPDLDADLVRCAGLLHDMASAQVRRRHARIGEAILANLGLPRLASVVGAHMVLPFDPAHSDGVNEQELLYLADKLVIEDRFAGLGQRASRALQSAENEATARLVRARIQTAARIKDKVEDLLGSRLEEALGLSPIETSSE